MKRLIFTLIAVIALFTTSFAQSSIKDFNEVETIDSAYNEENNTLEENVVVTVSEYCISDGTFYFNGSAIAYDIKGHRLLDAKEEMNLLIFPTGVYIIVSSCNDFKPLKIFITH